MARIYGLNGVLRGRQGNNVFSVQNGTQIVKAYQPAVSNPRTLPQREQRVKFALAGKMSACTPNLALLGMSATNTRARRARFVSLLTRTASVSGSLENLTATIPYESVIYSEGNLARFSASPAVTAAYTGTEVNSSVVVNIPAMSLNAAAPSGYGEIAVVALYDTRTSMLDEVQAIDRSKTTTDVLTFRQGTRRDVFVVVYVNPYNVTSRSSQNRASALEGSDTAVSLLGSASSYLSSAEWGVTNFIRAIPVLGATTSMAPSPDNDMRGVVEEALMETSVTASEAGTKRKK